MTALKKVLFFLLLFCVALTAIACDDDSDKKDDPDTNNGGNATVMCTVTFDSDGGSDVPQQTVTKGEKATKPTEPTKDGYIFAGWYIDDEE